MVVRLWPNRQGAAEPTSPANATLNADWRGHGVRLQTG